MRPQNSRFTVDPSRNDYRQSLSILSSELIRHSFSGESQAPSLYRESVGIPFKKRTSLNIELAEQILLGLER